VAFKFEFRWHGAGLRWVHTQQRLKKRLDRGEPAPITAAITHAVNTYFLESKILTTQPYYGVTVL
jgi:hypothetical protein